jgi:hypothetical protein
MSAPDATVIRSTTISGGPVHDQDPRQDPRLARIRKLLAQAEDPAATPAEAAAFTAKATTLIADYGIDEALLQEPMLTGTEVGDLVIDVLAPYASEKATLGSAVASALRCRAVCRKRAALDGTRFSLHMFGRSSDLTCVEILFTSLLLQGTAAMTVTSIPFGEHKAAFRRTWWLGFAGAVERRLLEVERLAARAAEARFADSGTSAALVLADHAREAEEAMKATYPRLQTASARRLTGWGAADGWLSGQRADLGSTARVGSSIRGEIAG